MRKFSILFLVCVFQLNAQLENAHWYFGERAGLSFQTGSPVPVYSSTMISPNSSTSISDSLGNLLFYLAEDQTVYNKTYSVMANGSGSISFSGFQSLAIVRKNGPVYYWFVQDMGALTNFPATSFLNYSVVDMGLAAGLGSVTIKGQTVSPAGLPLTMRLAVTPKCNGDGYWLLTHKGGLLPGSKDFYAYPVNSSGVGTVPVISSAGASLTSGWYGATQLCDKGIHKFSPNGRKLAATVPYRGVELYDFNSSTGQVSNAIKIDSIANPPPGFNGLNVNSRSLEFSPDGTKLYVTYVNENHPFLCQFDLSAGSASAIANSKLPLSPVSFSLVGFPIGVQLAPDGKIYVVDANSLALGVINFPNNPGAACGYSPQAVLISPMPVSTSTINHGLTLPTFPTFRSYQKPEIPSLTGTMNCGSGIFSMPAISPLAGYSLSSSQWNFGDPLSGSSNTSTAPSPNHTFSQNGTFTVQLLLNYFPCGTDTLRTSVTVTGLPEFSVSPSTTVCAGNSVSISIFGPGTYSLNGTAVSTLSTVQPSASSSYTVSTVDPTSGCSAKKAVSITVSKCNALPEAKENFNYRIFPNPTEGLIHLELEKPAIVRCVDLTGRVVHESENAAGTSLLDLSLLKSGLYFLQVESAGFCGNQKVILNR